MSATGDEEKTAIRCDEWIVSTIKEANMAAETTSFMAEDVKSMLRRLEGGITSKMVNDAINSYKVDLQQIVRMYIGAGFPNGVPKEVREGSLDTRSVAGSLRPRLAHQGVPAHYSMKCYTRTSFPSKEVFLQRNQTHDCVKQTLRWVISDKLKPSLWRNDLNSDYGIDPACHVLMEQSLKEIEGEGSLTGIYTFIQNLTVNTPATSDGIILDEKLAPLFKGIKMNNFFDQAYNDENHGLLLAELQVPDAPRDIKNDVVRKFIVEDKLAAHLSPQKDIFRRIVTEEYPCITPKDAEKNLDVCTPNSMYPEKLTEEHCDEMMKDALQQINDYKMEILSPTNEWPKTRYPPADSGLACFWDCGMESTDKDAVHIGLNKTEVEIMKNKTKHFHQQCMKAVTVNYSCYTYAAGTSALKEEEERLSEDSVTTYVQEVCAEIMTNFQYSTSQTAPGYQTEHFNNMVIRKYYETCGSAITDEDKTMEYIKAALYLGAYGKDRTFEGQNGCIIWQDGINKTFPSLLNDHRYINNERAYKCKAVQVIKQNPKAVNPSNERLSQVSLHNPFIMRNILCRKRINQSLSLAVLGNIRIHEGCHAALTSHGHEQVQTSGSEAVDRVRAGLSFNDIKVNTLCINGYASTAPLLSTNCTPMPSFKRPIVQIRHSLSLNG